MMISRFTPILTALFLSSVSYAADPINVTQANTNQLNTIKSLISASKANSLSAAKMEPTDGLHQLSQETDPSTGVTHTRYQQYANGLPVMGAIVITHESPSNNNSLLKSTGSSNAVRINGLFIDNISQDLTNTASKNLDNTNAIATAKNLFESQTQFNQWQYANEKAETVVALDDDNKAHAAYLVNFLASGDGAHQTQRPFYIIDAETNTLLKKWDGLMHISTVTAVGDGGNEKTGLYHYGQEYDPLQIYQNGNECKLENANVRTVDLKNAEYSMTNPAIYFSCQGPDYAHTSTPFHGAYGVEDDAHSFGTTIYNFYKDWYGIPPISSKLIMRVHYGVNYENAFWDGRTMSFGDGDNDMYPLVALDVTAHEISHGFTEQHSNLEYHDEPGSLNEAFSDMAGKTAEFYANKPVKWGIGSEIVKKGHGYTCLDGTKDALRCMDKPEADHISISQYKNFSTLVDRANNIGKMEYPNDPAEAKDTAQSIIVHTGSGLFNYVFYQLATTPGWDVHKAFDVMLKANRYYWTPKTDFLDAAHGVMQATSDLHYNQDDVSNAFLKAGIYCTAEACNPA